MTTTPETVTTGTKPHLTLAGLAQQAGYAYRFAKAGQVDEAVQHLDAMERLGAAYRLKTGEWEAEAIHLHFSLSYANYLVLPRTLLQSMPDEWQARFVTLLDELHDAFQHIPQAEAYEVTAGTEHIVNEMSEAELKQAGIVANWFRGETPPEGLDAEDLAEWEEAHEDPEGPVYSRDGEELGGHERVLLPATDPVPHYNRGRAYIEPRLGGGE